MTFLEQVDGAGVVAADPMIEARGRWPAEAFAPSADRSVAVAQTSEDLLAIGRLRYELFVARDGKAYAHADHDARSFIEPVDYLSLNFWAHDGDNCVAAVRLTRAVDALGAAHLADVVEHAGLTTDEVRETVIASRMVILDNLRARLRITPLVRRIYRAGLISGAKRSLIALRPEVEPLFARFGFVPWGKVYNDRVAGKMIVMVIERFNREHLVTVRSPLLKDHDEILRPSRVLTQKVSA